MSSWPYLFCLSSSFCVLPNSAIQFHQLPSRCSIFSPLIWTTAGLLRHKNALIQTLMVVLISMPQRWWQLWNMAWGSETLLWCSWRKNRKARAGESSQGRAPRSTAPPLARARLREGIGTYKGTACEALFGYPLHSSKTSHPKPSQNLQPHEIQTHSTLQSGQFWALELWGND